MVAMEVLKDQNLLGIKIYILLSVPLLNECATYCNVDILPIAVTEHSMIILLLNR